MSFLNDFPDAEIKENEFDKHLQKEVELKGDVDIKIPKSLQVHIEDETIEDETINQTIDDEDIKDPEDNEEEIGLVMMLVLFAWPKIFNLLDKRFVQSGVGEEHYQLEADQTEQLQTAMYAVLKKWMRIKSTPEQKLIATIVTIGGMQMFTASMVKSENEKLKKSKKREQAEQAENIEFEENE